MSEMSEKPKENVMTLNDFMHQLKFISQTYNYAAQDNDGSWYVFSYPIEFNGLEWRDQDDLPADLSRYSSMLKGAFNYPSLEHNDKTYLKRVDGVWEIMVAFERPDWEPGDIFLHDDGISSRCSMFMGWLADEAEDVYVAKFSLNGMVRVDKEGAKVPSKKLSVRIGEEKNFTRIGRVNVAWPEPKKESE